jgi:serine/threonine protein kinase
LRSDSSRSDRYALGVSLYEMLTGFSRLQLPNQNQSGFAIPKQINHQKETYHDENRKSIIYTRLKALMERGFHRAGDVENRVGHYVGRLGATSIQDE